MRHTCISNLVHYHPSSGAACVVGSCTWLTRHPPAAAPAGYPPGHPVYGCSAVCGWGVLGCWPAAARVTSLGHLEGHAASGCAWCSMAGVLLCRIVCFVCEEEDTARQGQDVCRHVQKEVCSFWYTDDGSQHTTSTPCCCTPCVPTLCTESSPTFSGHAGGQSAGVQRVT